MGGCILGVNGLVHTGGKWVGAYWGEMGGCILLGGNGCKWVGAYWGKMGVCIVAENGWVHTGG